MKITKDCDIISYFLHGSFYLIYACLITDDYAGISLLVIPNADYLNQKSVNADCMLMILKECS